MAENIKSEIENNPNIGNPRTAEPGKGAAGKQLGVQTAQSTDVNDPEAVIPSDADVDQNKEQIKEAAEQEKGKMPTTHGYVIDESGKIDNFAVEPPIRVEKD